MKICVKKLVSDLHKLQLQHPTFPSNQRLRQLLEAATSMLLRKMNFLLATKLPCA